MKDLIESLKSTYSLEAEFEVEKTCNAIQETEDLELLKSQLIKLVRSHARQSHFICNAINMISSYHVMVNHLEKKLNKKKTTFWDRFLYAVFHKKRSY